MAKITLEVPDELLEQLTQLGERLPELLALSLQQPLLLNSEERLAERQGLCAS